MEWFAGILFVLCIIEAIYIIHLENELDVRDFEAEEDRKRAVAKTIIFPKRPLHLVEDHENQ